MLASVEHWPRVAAITLNWNGRDDTLECVAALKRLAYPRLEIVVVDNASADGSVEAFKTQYADITVLTNEANVGYAEGFNRGLEWAYRQGFDYFLIINNDTVIDPEALTELVKLAESQVDIGFVSGKVYWFNDPTRLQTAGRLSDPDGLVGGHVASGEIDAGQVDQVREYDFVDDIFLLVRRAVYEQVGGYDPNFFLYYEETDWCARTRRAGFRLLYTPYAKIWHKGRVGNAGLNLSPMRYYYLWRNRIVFVSRNATLAQRRRFLRAFVPDSILGVARLVKRGLFRHALAQLRGTAAGLFWLWRDRAKSCS
jgi:GT2 family glycosyltransferase